ncbi:PepSY-like domain-containing protein [Christiangramia sediminis]|uniref:PepSY-like domain-containing protein n=1 Tax=Christiangramia sediminis TaxID=2881336 RepID=A0A9X1RWN9_9FLAO|nr:PepSY-like domain-containing protein [Christiangramia sediminis]MCB7479795.1 PepSY-like domain-containing protein [Christiangramia sediminis]
MRRLVFMSLFAVFFITGCAQKNVTKAEIPSVVLNAFKAEFDNPENSEWEMEGNDFEVEFDIAEVEHKALLDSDGKLLKYKKDITQADLPKAVVAILEAEFSDKKYDDFELLNINGEEYYQIEIDETLRDKNIVFTASGENATDIPVWD